MSDVKHWRWICINCGFIHISECSRERIDEVLAVKALCPTCKAELRAPLEQSEAETAVIDYYAG